MAITPACRAEDRGSIPRALISFDTEEEKATVIAINQF